MNNIEIETKIGETLRIPIFDRITVITGNSSTGKTKLIKWLKACKMVPNDIVKTTIDLNKVVFITEQNDMDYVMNKGLEDYIVFIDHYSFFEDNNELRNFILYSKNIFIVIGHRNTSALTSQDAILYLDYDGMHYTCKQVYENGPLNPAVII